MYVFHIFQFEVRINSFYCEADTPKLSSLFSTPDDFSTYRYIFIACRGESGRFDQKVLYCQSYVVEAPEVTWRRDKIRVGAFAVIV